MKGLNIYIKLIWVMLIFSLFIRCERRPLEDDIIPDTKAIIPVTVYWDLAHVIPQNVNILVYDETGNLYLEKAFENSGSYGITDILLEKGKYTVVVFNEKRDQIDYVNIRGHEKLSTLEAYATPATKVYDTQSKAEKDAIVNQPGRLATTQASIIVDEQLIAFSHEKKKNGNLDMPTEVEDGFNALINLHPVLKTSLVNIDANISGLNNARLPVLAELRNMSGGYFFATDKNSTVPTTIQFMMDKRIYRSGSGTDGQLLISVNSFGFLGDRKTIQSSPIYLNLMFQLVDKERTVVNFSADVTNNITIELDEVEDVTIDIKSFYGTLPTVKPEGSSDSGFNTDVIDWDSVVIPIKF